MFSRRSGKNFFSCGKRLFSLIPDTLTVLPKVTRFIIFANCGIYFLRTFMNKGIYARNFLYNKNEIRKGKLQSLITAHLAKINLFDLVCDAVATAMLGRSVESLLGSSLFAKLVFASAGFGSIILLTMHREKMYIKSDAILRGMLMYLILTNPSAKFTVFPFPFLVNAKWIGGTMMLLDCIRYKWVNFGGSLAGFLLWHKLI